MTTKLIALVALLAACPGSGGKAIGPTSNTGGGAPTDYLVWTTEGDEDKPPHTVWLSAAGSVLAEREGLFFAAGERLWQWTTIEVAGKTCDCECFEAAGGAACEQDTTSKVDQLSEVGGGATVALSEGGATGGCDEGMGESDCHAVPVGAVGPYLFVADSCHLYFCGAAHGETGWSFRVWDLTSGKQVDLHTADELAAIARTEQPIAVAQFTARVEDDGDDVWDADKAALTMARPRWGGAELALDLQFTAGTSYAMSDGEWDSYTTSTTVPASRLPELLAGFATIPAPVRDHLMKAELGESAAAGWSAVPPAMLAAFK